MLSRFGLVLSLNYQGADYPENIITINGTKIKNVQSFKYLGSTITYNEPGTSEKELTNRNGMVHGKFSELKRLPLCNYHGGENYR